MNVYTHMHTYHLGFACCQENVLMYTYPCASPLYHVWLFIEGKGGSSLKTSRPESLSCRNRKARKLPRRGEERERREASAFGRMFKLERDHGFEISIGKTVVSGTVTMYGRSAKGDTCDICIYLCVCMYVCMHACMYVCMHVCMHVCVYVCMHVCMNVCMSVCMHACGYECMYVCMFTLGISGSRVSRISIQSPNCHLPLPHLCTPPSPTASSGVSGFIRIAPEKSNAWSVQVEFSVFLGFLGF